RHPAESGGVTRRPPIPTNTLEPVPSHRLPARLPKIASPAPRSRAYARATTFSAYETLFTPASALRSLRGHGTVTTGLAGRVGVGESPVDPDLHALHALHASTGTSAPDATRTSLRALSSVSCHSPSGVDPHVMPPPVPKWIAPSSNQNVRMATLSSPVPVSA